MNLEINKELVVNATTPQDRGSTTDDYVMKTKYFWDGHRVLSWEHKREYRFETDKYVGMPCVDTDYHCGTCFLMATTFDAYATHCSAQRLV